MVEGGVILGGRRGHPHIGAPCGALTFSASFLPASSSSRASRTCCVSWIWLTRYTISATWSRTHERGPPSCCWVNFSVLTADADRCTLCLLPPRLPERLPGFSSQTPSERVSNSVATYYFNSFQYFSEKSLTISLSLSGSFMPCRHLRPQTITMNKKGCMTARIQGHSSGRAGRVRFEIMVIGAVSCLQALLVVCDDSFSRHFYAFTVRLTAPISWTSNRQNN